MIRYKYSPTPEEKNEILMMLGKTPVIRPELTEKTLAILEELEKDLAVEILRDNGKAIITFSITNYGRQKLKEGGY